MRMKPILEWLASAKSWLSPLLCLVAAGALITGWYCTPVPAEAISLTTMYGSSVGEVQTTIGRRGVSGGTMGLGYGIGSGSSILLFSKVLMVTEQDMDKIRAAGGPYEVGVHNGTVLTIAGSKGVVISYD